MMNNILFVYCLCTVCVQKQTNVVQVVAPVRETTAQVLGIISSHLATEDMLLLQGLFLQLLGSEEWQARHGGLLAIKYLLAARQVPIYCYFYRFT